MIERVVHKTLHETPEAATHWSIRKMARAVGLSYSSVRAGSPPAPQDGRRTGQVAQEPLGLVCVVLVPGLTDDELLDARVQMLGQALDDRYGPYVDPLDKALDGGGPRPKVFRIALLSALRRASTMNSRGLRRIKKGRAWHEDALSIKRHGTTTVFSVARPRPPARTCLSPLPSTPITAIRNG